VDGEAYSGERMAVWHSVCQRNPWKPQTSHVLPGTSLNPVDSIVRRKRLPTECSAAGGVSAGSLPDVSTDCSLRRRCYAGMGLGAGDRQRLTKPDRRRGPVEKAAKWMGALSSRRLVGLERTLARSPLPPC
jgi:hypothetical protein